MTTPRFATVRCTALRAVCCVAALGFVTVGCGSPGSTSAADADGIGETVTIDHRYGATEAPVKPRRIVSLDKQWTDVLAALDHAPTAHLADPNIADGLPWRDTELREAATLHATTALPFEQIAATHPDLIVVSYLAESKTAYDKLSKIAPTIATLGSGTVDTWRAITKAAGKILDDPAAAEALIEKVSGGIDAVRTELPGLQGKTM
ncbi:MAG TPA: ABC transporter substrate-binding protein, partial [Acidimicrobiales bacterium]|nr:ABC transporter substrate-binding protein [Acidimicrobiales bacterium]